MRLGSKISNCVILIAASQFSSGARGSLSTHYTVTDLGPMVNTWSINDRGDLVGDQMVNHSIVAVYVSGDHTIPLFAGSGETAHPLGLNNHGLAFGQLQGTVNSPGVWLNGELQVNPLPANAISYVSINDNGDSLYAAAGKKGGHFVLRAAGKDTDLGNLGSSDLIALNLNNDETVAATGESTGRDVSVLWQRGVTTKLGTLGGKNTVIGGLSNIDEVVGASDARGGHSHGFTFENGKMIDIGTLPGDARSGLYGVNDSGVAVGASEQNGPTPEEHAVIWSGQQLIDLNSQIAPSANWKLTVASHINNQGQILGVGNHGAEQDEFLLTPIAGNAIPLPSPVLIGATTFPLAMWVAKGRRRRRTPKSF